MSSRGGLQGSGQRTEGRSGKQGTCDASQGAWQGWDPLVGEMHHWGSCLLLEFHSSDQGAAMAGWVSLPGWDPLLTAVVSAEPLQPTVLVSPGDHPHLSPGAGPPGFPMGATLAKHQPHQICSK